MDGGRRPGWSRRLREALGAAVHVDRAAAQPVAALRYAGGTGALLLVGLTTMNPQLAIVLASGAVNAGAIGVNLQLDRPRFTMLVTTAALSLSLFLACLTADRPVLAVLALAAIGALAGLLSGASQATSVIGVQAMVGFVVLGQRAAPLPTALTYAGLAAVGGLVQVVLGLLLRLDAQRTAAASVPGLRHRVERPQVPDLAPLDDVSRDAVASLRHPDQATRWHALRLGLGLGVAEALAQLLDGAQGYWVPLTVTNVVKPQWADTVGRGIDRLLGTVLGLVLWSGLVAWLQPQGLSLIVLATFLAWAMFTLQFVNYLCYTAVLTGWVVVFLEVSGVHAPDSAPHRLLATAIGGALSFLLLALVRTTKPYETGQGHA